MAQPTRTGFFNALGIVAYITLVSVLMANADRLFDEHTTGFLPQIAFLALFTLSAAVVGGLILGKPLMLYLDNQKKAAVSLFLETIGWLASFTVLLLAALALAS